MATQSDISGIVRGDTLTINISAQNDNLTPIDLTGYTIFFTLRKYYDTTDTTDTRATIEKTWVSAGSSTSIVITATEMKIEPTIYKYDVQYKDLGNNIVTIAYGDFEIINEATNRATI
jgi:hypothetical protein